jgi:predicted metalloendopeptidase
MCHGVQQVYARTQGGLTLLDTTYYSSADRSAVLDQYSIRIQELRMLVRMSAAAANSTAHDAIAVEARIERLSRSDARQLQQLPKCVDRPMVWVRKGCYRR